MVPAIVTAVLVASIAASTVLAAVLLDTPRLTPTRATLAAYLLSTGAWSVVALLSGIGVVEDVSTQVALTMPIVALVVSTAIAFSLALPDPSWRPSLRSTALLSLHPLIMLVIAVIPAAHPLVSVETADGAAYGWFFWVHAGYAYVALTIAFFRVAPIVGGLSNKRRRLPLGSIAIWTLPLLANIYTVVVDGADGVDVTPIAFFVTAAFVGKAVFRDGLADVVPVARLRVFENLGDAVVVLSNTNRLVDANPAAYERFAQLGVDAPKVGTPIGSMDQAVREAFAGNGPRDVAFADGTKVMDVNRTELLDHRGKVLGTLIHVRDVTDTVTRTRELERLADALAAEVRINKALRTELADQVIRDHATGLHNRRYVLDRLPEIVTRCHRESIPLALVMFDLDHFKAINDTYGHPVGDRALVAVADVMSKHVGDGVLARFGGEEFLLVLPGSTEEQAHEIADRVRAACEALRVPARGAQITVTVSAGVAAATPPNLDAHRLIDAADEAMYAAKRAGRNATGRASDAEI